MFFWFGLGVDEAVAAELGQGGGITLAARLGWLAWWLWESRRSAVTSTAGG